MMSLYLIKVYRQFCLYRSNVETRDKIAVDVKQILDNLTILVAKSCSVNDPKGQQSWISTTAFAD